jgi:shikimate 5-dehydrogenase
LIFGSGGSSKSVEFALHSMGIDYKIVSRKKNCSKIYTLSCKLKNLFNLLILNY